MAASGGRWTPATTRPPSRSSRSCSASWSGSCSWPSSSRRRARPGPRSCPEAGDQWRSSTRGGRAGPAGLAADVRRRPQGHGGRAGTGRGPGRDPGDPQGDEPRRRGHNLSMDGGPKTPDLKPHQTATLTLGAVAKAMPGACSIPGHKEAGMTFEVRVSGTAPAAAAADHSDTAVDDSAKLDPTPPRRPPGRPTTPPWPAHPVRLHRPPGRRHRRHPVGAPHRGPVPPPVDGARRRRPGCHRARGGLRQLGSVAELGQGGIERWIVYPIVLWLVAFGSWIMAAPTGSMQRASD
jgi:hypothetical protein